MDCSNAVKQGMKQPGGVDAAALLDLALDEIAAVNDKEVGKPPFGVGVARISALNRLFAADLEREGHGLQLQDQIDRLIEKKGGLINKAIESLPTGKKTKPSRIAFLSPTRPACS